MDITKLDDNQKQLRRRILEISQKSHTSHIGSCLSAIDLVDAIFEVKDKNEKFILSNGHAGVALYVVLERKGLIKNPDLDKLHVHPDRNSDLGIDVSTGSLGQGLCIGVGLALADARKKVYVMLSDGECSEGSVWEALRIADEQKLSNLIILINANGWGAYGPISTAKLIRRFKGFVDNVVEISGHDRQQILNFLSSKESGVKVAIAKTNSDQFSFLNGLDAHYHVMTDEEYRVAMEQLI